jgi:hypothetical protein
MATHEHHEHHDPHAAHHSVRDDRSAAYLGLVGGAIFIFAVLFTVVRLTNAKFAHERGERPAAAATK